MELFFPLLTVVFRPVDERCLKADVVSCLLALDPFVLQDFLSFSNEFMIERDVLGGGVIVQFWHRRYAGSCVS